LRQPTKSAIRTSGPSGNDFLQRVFCSTEPSQVLGKRELKTLLAAASTPEDHNRLAEHYRLRAERLEAEANEHIGMASARPKPLDASTSMMNPR
jgi:hypothetical protein